MISSHLVKKHNAKDWQVYYLIGMLYEWYILSLPCLKKDRIAYCDTFPQKLLWLWANKILG